MKDRLMVPPNDFKYKGRYTAEDNDVFKPSEVFDALLNIAEFKKIQNEDKRNNSKSSMNITIINSTNDLNLIETIKDANYPDKQYNIVNSFLDNDINPRMLNYNIDNNNIYSSFSFEDKVNDLINKALNPGEDAFQEKMEENKVEITNEDIIDMCLHSSPLKQNKISIPSSISSTSKHIRRINTNEEKDIIKKKAIFEYENQIVSYQTLNEIDIKARFAIHPSSDEDIDLESYYFFKALIKTQSNRLLRNKLKLTMKAINYIDPYINKNLLDNSTRNKIYRYWKRQYLKELEKILEEEKERKEKEEAEKSLMKHIKRTTSLRHSDTKLNLINRNKSIKRKSRCNSVGKTHINMSIGRSSKGIRKTITNVNQYITKE